jgi:hypothetical protein
METKKISVCQSTRFIISTLSLLNSIIGIAAASAMYVNLKSIGNFKKSRMILRRTKNKIIPSDNLESSVKRLLLPFSGIEFKVIL